MTSHLTRPVEQQKFLKEITYPGMAAWAGRGPAGRTCRECSLFKSPGYYSAKGQKGGGLKPGKCLWAVGGMKTSGKAFPHDAKACKHFIENPNPPPSFSKGKW